MADLLGFAYKVIVIALIVVAIGVALASAASIVTAVQAPADALNGEMLTGYPDQGASPNYSPLTLVKPFLDSFQFDSAGGDLDFWAILKGLVVAVPALIVSALTVRWLIRAAK